MKTLLLVVNVGWFFMSHRLPIAIAAKNAGYRVHVAAALDAELDQGTESKLSDLGIVLHRLRFSRSGANPIELLRDFIDILRLYLRVRPDVVHLVTLKPLLLGGVAAKLARIKHVVLAVPGRGSVFSAKGLLATFRRWAALVFYRLAYRPGRNRVIVQNVEDRNYFLSRGVFSEADVHLIRGSGVDIRAFMPAPELQSEPLVVFASRMLKEKGVEDFVAAAEELGKREIRARFALVGDADPGNPHSHTRNELEAWAASGVVEWWGYRSRMCDVFGACQVVCLPTYYGEGVPKALIEAAACARPIVTSDIPGCRDIVRDGYNGFLIKPRDVQGIADAIEKLLRNRELRQRMGVNGRRLVESEFSLEKVISQTLDVYREFVS